MNTNAMLTLDIGNFDTEIAARVAQRFVLKGINLVDAKISRDPMIISPATLSLEHKGSTECLSSGKDNELSFYLCNFRVAAFDGHEPNKLIMKIEAAFCTSYVKKSQPDPLIPEDNNSPETLLAYVEHLMTINPISDAWPYWREFVQSMSARMGFPALTVPLLEIRPKKSTDKEPKSPPIKKKSTRRKKVSA